MAAFCWLLSLFGSIGKQPSLGLPTHLSCNGADMLDLPASSWWMWLYLSMSRICSLAGWGVLFKGQTPHPKVGLRRRRRREFGLPDEAMLPFSPISFTPSTACLALLPVSPNSNDGKWVGNVCYFHHHLERFNSRIIMSNQAKLMMKKQKGLDIHTHLI